MSYYDTSYPPSLWAPPPPPDPPSLTSVVPSTGVSGTSVTLGISGTGFTADSTVKQGGSTLPTTYIGPTALSAVWNPLPAAGTVQISVTNENGTSNTSPFTVTAAEELAAEPPPETP